MRSAELGAMALLLTACTVPDGLLDDRPCPCLEGWVCDATRNVCVEGDLPPVDAGRDEDGGALADGGPGDAAAADASAMDAGPPEPPPAVDTTCWLRAETCDWTGDFELVPGDPAVIGFATLSRNPAFSPDGCELYSTRSAGAFVASRENAGDAFGPSAEVSGLEGTGAGKASITPERPK